MEAQGPVALDVTVIVVSFESEAVIERCLAAVAQAVTRHTSELILVDNGSRDETVRRAREVWPTARAIELERNVGFAVANNLAIEQAQGRYVALVNSDAFPDPGAIDLLIERADRDPRVGIVGGRLRDAEGHPQPSSGSFPTLLGELGVALFFHRLPLLWRLPLSVSANSARYLAPAPVDWVTGAFCLARREVGPMPAAAFMYGEDVEWSRQAHEIGFEVWVEPAARAVHLGGGGSSSRQAARLRQASRVDFALRWFAPGGKPGLRGIRAVLVLHGAVRVALFTLALPVRGSRARGAIAEFCHLIHEALRGRGPL
jgi:N-acetylglucosaminyl-diphospho-decaprenol L-rhamnosyltransferase